MPQDCLRTYYNKQSWGFDLPARLCRRPKQVEHKRLPSPRRYISRVCLLPDSSLTSHQTNLTISVHAITTRLHPLSHHTDPRASIPAERPDAPSGIEVLETENFRLQCFSTLTGTKFLLFTEPQQPNVDTVIRRIYELYSDYVMKNPFYQMEMPIRCEAFDRGLLKYLRPLNSR